MTRSDGRIHRCWLALALFMVVSIATNLTAQPQPLEPSRTIQAELAAGQSHDYQLHLRPGEYARLVIQQQTVDVAVACFGPDGQQLFVIDRQVIGDAETVEMAGEA